MESFFAHRVLFVVTIASLGIALGALWEDVMLGLAPARCSRLC